MLPPRELVFAVLLPLLAEIGRRWEAGTCCGRHRSTWCRRPCAAFSAGYSAPSPAPGVARAIVFATPAGERHELGLFCAALLAAHAGYGVVYLGADVPAADIAHAAETTAARAVMIGATTPGATPISDLRALLEMPAGIDLWIGGQASAAMLAGSRGRARHLARLEDVVPALKG